MFKKMPLLLIAIIALVLLLNPFIPVYAKQILFTISINLKSVILFFLPWIIFSLLFKAVVNLSKNATKVIFYILFFVCLSNFLSTFLSHYIGIVVYHFNLSLMTPQESHPLKPLWTLHLPTLISNDKAMFSGLLLGFIGSTFFQKNSIQLSIYLEKIVHQILKLIIYCIPFFIIGFVIKLKYDGVINLILKDYAFIFLIIAISQFSYICLWYYALSHFKKKKFFISIRNMFPAALTGFSTMSSAASMPLTILGVEKNCSQKEIARSVVPATVNIHLLGDCFAIPILAFAILKSFGMPEPSFINYLIFTFYFVLAKFSVAAIPGGGILVMLPILEKYLGFKWEMMSLITALYILFDPVVTAANILGNGAFAKWIDKVVKISKK